MCTYRNHVIFRNMVLMEEVLQLSCGKLIVLQQIHFIPNDKIRNLLLLNPRQNSGIFIGYAVGGINDKKSNISLVEDLISLLHAHSSKRTGVIKTGRVDHHYRTQWEKLHRL